MLCANYAWKDTHTHIYLLEQTYFYFLYKRQTIGGELFPFRQYTSKRDFVFKAFKQQTTIKLQRS